MSINQLGDAFWANEDDLLYTILVTNLVNAASTGAQTALDELLAHFGLGVDWASVSADVHQWATNYTFDLVKGINTTSRTFLQKAVSDWQTSGQPLDDLVATLEPSFGATRAQMIASTEVTRAFHQGNLQTWEASSIVDGFTFRTAVDDRVCPLCSPNDGQTFALDDDANAPPLHVQCRCYSQPHVKASS